MSFSRYGGFSDLGLFNTDEETRSQLFLATNES
jgi:hypothetical protein